MNGRMALRGYTVVELMMSLSVLAIGVSGIIAMQKVTVASNQHAKNLAIATAIAEAWADALAADSSSWNSDTDLGSTTWLSAVPDANPAWTRPAHSNTLSFGPGFSALGDPVTDMTLARFCTNVRLTWVRRTDQVPGSGLIRAEVRVFWKRDNAFTQNAIPANVCAVSNTPSTVEENADGYHFVFLTTAVSQQVGA